MIFFGSVFRGTVAKRRWHGLVTAMLLVFAHIAACRASDGMPLRPNILFLYADDLGYGDLACYGSKLARTPHLDRLAAEGTRFEQFYVSHCVCSPTRASAITGQFPARQRIYGHLAQLAANKNRRMPNYLSADAPSLPRALQDCGYRTAMIGKWHLGGGSGQMFRGQPINDPTAPPVEKYGFDFVRVTFGNGPTWKQAKPSPEPHEIYPYEDEMWQRYSSRAIADEAIRMLDQHVKRHSDQPFYANVWFKDAHVPFNPTPEMLAPFAALPEPARTHYAMIHTMDAQIGRILAHLDKLGLADNTLVIFSSDNGAAIGRGGSNGRLRSGKHTIYEGGIRVPLVARWPGRVPAGRVDTTSLLNIVDFTPTFTALAGAAMPPGYQSDGEDISAALFGQAFERVRPMFWHQLPRPDSPELAVRRGRWKLLMTAGGDELQLHDLENDPAESTNLAAQKSETAASLRALLSDWYDEIDPSRQPSLHPVGQ